MLSIDVNGGLRPAKSIELMSREQLSRDGKGTETIWRAEE